MQSMGGEACLQRTCVTPPTKQKEQERLHAAIGRGVGSITNYRCGSDENGWSFTIIVLASLFADFQNHSTGYNSEPPAGNSEKYVAKTQNSLDRYFLILYLISYSLLHIFFH